MESTTAGWARLRAAIRPQCARDEGGAAFVEYAMLFAFVVLVCILAVTMVGSTNAESLSSSGSILP